MISSLFTIFNRLRESQVITLNLESKPTSVLCHMGDFGCGAGGWTPVMKIDGNKVLTLVLFFSSITSIPSLKEQPLKGSFWLRHCEL